jgi:hypothetical protein
MKYILLLFFAACATPADDAYYEGKKAVFEIAKRDVDSLLVEGNALWDSLSKLTPPSSNRIMRLDGRLDALKQLSIKYGDSLVKYATINSR